MGRKRKQKKSNIFIVASTFIFTKLLLFFKAIGELVITVFKTIPQLLILSYNNISQNCKKMYYSPKKAFSLKRKGVIFYKMSLIWKLKKRINNYRFPFQYLAFPYTLKSFFWKVKYFSLGIIVTVIVVGAYLSHSFTKSLPNPSYLTLQNFPTTTKIYDRNGILLYDIYAEENRMPLRYDEFPDIAKKATIAIEDKEFFLHNGFSLKGIGRAILHNINSGSLEGGSTITQQLVRSALLSPEKTFERKIKEVILSIWTEQLYTKDQILEMYLNQVPYGGTAWGIEAAAQTYFGKSIRDASLAEVALLVGLPSAPSLYSPFGAHPETAKMRQEQVLNNMAEMGYITNEEKQTALAQTLNYRSQRSAIKAPHFVMYVKELLEKHYGTRITEKGGLRVTTTLDLNIQETAEEVVAKNVEGLRQLSVSNGAALITNPKNGEILAMVGSADYFNQQNNGNVNVTTSLRPPGSSIKVVTYAAALAKGMTAASVLYDVPITYRTDTEVYSPVNYDGRYHGAIPLRNALACSYNIPAVKLLGQIGIKEMINQGRLMGITSWNDENRYGLSLTLGGGEVTMLDMAKVYGSLANNGTSEDLTPFLKITDYKGETLPLPSKRHKTNATSPEIAFILSNILADNQARTPAFGPNSALVIPGKTVSVKTGTSDSKRDNWTVGYTPDYVATIWVGNNDNSPMNQALTSGITGAAPIWHEIMERLLKDKEDKPFTSTENIVSMSCLGHTEYFVKGTEPKNGCHLPNVSLNLYSTLTATPSVVKRP